MNTVLAAPVICRRLAHEIRAAALAQVARGAGIGVDVLATAGDLTTRELARLAFFLELNVSDLVGPARLMTGDVDHDLARIGAAIHQAAVEHVALAADVDPTALDDEARHLTIDELAAIAGVLGMEASDLVRAAQAAGGAR